MASQSPQDSKTPTEVWSPPAGATGILLINCLGQFINIFYKTGIEFINQRTIKAVTCDGKTIIVMGGEIIDRTLTFTEKSLTDILAPFCTEVEKLTPTVQEQHLSHKSARYLIRYSYNNMIYVCVCREKVEIINENTFALTNGPRYTITSANQQMMCLQFRDDNSRDFSLDTLPQITEGEPIMRSR